MTMQLLYAILPTKYALLLYNLFEAVACPTNSVGTPPSCGCSDGYSGTITPVAAGYTGSCTGDISHIDICRHG